LSGDRVAADVAGQPIRLSDLEARAALLRRGPAARHVAPAAKVGADDWVRRWAVRQLVGQAVIEYETGAVGASSPTGALEAAVRQLVARVTEPVEVTERAVRSFYERNLDLYRSAERRRVRLVAVAGRDDALRARDRLLAGSTGTDGVMDLGRGEYIGALEDAVFAARVGDVVGPILTEHGWLVARVESVQAASTVSYAAVRAAIAAELLDVARARAFDDWLELRRRALARVAPELEHPADPVHGQPRHRH
jgi:[acyl-carrier-protein] S-malonyltransferase